MNTSNSRTKMYENEAVFRNYNEKVTKGFEQLKAIATEDDQLNMIGDIKAQLMFFCECSDENCRARIKMSAERYQAIHENRAEFIVLPNHQVIAIETVVEKFKTYSIVRKFMAVSDDATLSKTSIDNVS